MKRQSPENPSIQGSRSQFDLLKKRRFAPFFWTQCSGALNDNLFKTALAVLLAFQTSATGGAAPHLMVNLAAGLFILPFFLFSAMAGQVADKFEKSALIRRIKAAEIFIMACAAGALVCNQTWLMLMMLFGWDLTYACTDAARGSLTGVWQFVTAPGAWRVLADLGLIGLSGGLYIVPLFTLLQTRTPPAVRSRLIAANNVLNALFMVVSAIVGALVLAGAGWSLNRFFMLLALLNLGVAIYVCRVTPVFVLRLAVWALTRIMYRIRCRDLDRIPAAGPAVLVCNHVSYVDALIIAGSCRRPVRFVMHADYYRIPGMRWLFHLAGAIPIASARIDPGALRQAMKRIAASLAAGELVCLFPEGRLTRTGEVDAFRPGIESIVRRSPVPVIPLALKGLWGSMFSHKHGPALRQRPRRLWARVELLAGQRVPPHQVTAGYLHRQVIDLRSAPA